MAIVRRASFATFANPKIVFWILYKMGMQSTHLSCRYLLYISTLKPASSALLPIPFFLPFFLPSITSLLSSTFKNRVHSLDLGLSAEYLSSLLYSLEVWQHTGIVVTASTALCWLKQLSTACFVTISVILLLRMRIGGRHLRPHWINPIPHPVKSIAAIGVWYRINPH